MTIFSGKPDDLVDLVAYELSAIDFLRIALHDHDESPSGKTKLTLGDLTPDGELRRAISMVVRADITGTAVRSALGRLRPLAFSASFKLQDMIVEWILRANGVSEWRFRKKLDEYDRLRTSGSLACPQLLTVNTPVSTAFWELYRFFVPFRGTVVHSGGVVLRSDGAVSITNQSGVLELTQSQQASYMRAMCLIGKALSSQRAIDSFAQSLIESDLLHLAVHHKQPGLTATHSRLAALEVDVPSSHLRTAPVAFDVDFDLLRRTMENTYTAGAAVRLFFSTTLTAMSDEKRFRWDIPFEETPTGIVTIRQGDPRWDAFLTISEQ